MFELLDIFLAFLFKLALYIEIPRLILPIPWFSSLLLLISHLQWLIHAIFTLLKGALVLIKIMLEMVRVSVPFYIVTGFSSLWQDLRVQFLVTNALLPAFILTALIAFAAPKYFFLWLCIMFSTTTTIAALVACMVIGMQIKGVFLSLEGFSDATLVWKDSYDSMLPYNATKEQVAAATLRHISSVGSSTLFQSRSTYLYSGLGICVGIFWLIICLGSMALFLCYLRTYRSYMVNELHHSQTLSKIQSEKLFARTHSPMRCIGTCLMSVCCCFTAACAIVCVATFVPYFFFPDWSSQKKSVMEIPLTMLLFALPVLIPIFCVSCCCSLSEFYRSGSAKARRFAVGFNDKVGGTLFGLVVLLLSITYLPLSKRMFKLMFFNCVAPQSVCSAGEVYVHTPHDWEAALDSILPARIEGVNVSHSFERPFCVGVGGVNDTTTSALGNFAANALAVSLNTTYDYVVAPSDPHLQCNKLLTFGAIVTNIIYVIGVPLLFIGLIFISQQVLSNLKVNHILHLYDEHRQQLPSTRLKAAFREFCKKALCWDPYEALSFVIRFCFTRSKSHKVFILKTSLVSTPVTRLYSKYKPFFRYTVAVGLLQRFALVLVTILFSLIPTYGIIISLAAKGLLHFLWGAFVTLIQPYQSGWENLTDGGSSLLLAFNSAIFIVLNSRPVDQASVAMAWSLAIVDVLAALVMILIGLGNILFPLLLRLKNFRTEVSVVIPSSIEMKSIELFGEEGPLKQSLLSTSEKETGLIDEDTIDTPTERSRKHLSMIAPKKRTNSVGLSLRALQKVSLSREEYSAVIAEQKAARTVIQRYTGFCFIISSTFFMFFISLGVCIIFSDILSDITSRKVGDLLDIVPHRIVAPFDDSSWTPLVYPNTTHEYSIELLPSLRNESSVQTFDFVGYASWNAFAESCSCKRFAPSFFLRSNLITDGKLSNVQVTNTEHWICDNGAEKLRVRMNMDGVHGYMLRDYCAKDFKNNTVVELVRHQRSGDLFPAVVWSPYIEQRIREEFDDLKQYGRDEVLAVLW